jgi:hypothetical protein
MTCLSFDGCALAIGKQWCNATARESRKGYRLAHPTQPLPRGRAREERDALRCVHGTIRAMSLPTTTVAIGAVVPASRRAAVVASFEEAGCCVEAFSPFAAKGGEASQWIVEVALKETIDGFFLALGAAAFGALLRAVCVGDGEETGRLDLVDCASKRVSLLGPLPEAALNALGDIEWRSIRGGWLTWHADRSEWVLDESAAG